MKVHDYRITRIDGVFLAGLQAYDVSRGGKPYASMLTIKQARALTGGWAKLTRDCRWLSLTR